MSECVCVHRMPLNTAIFFIFSSTFQINTNSENNEGNKTAQFWKQSVLLNILCSNFNKNLGHPYSLQSGSLLFFFRNLDKADDEVGIQTWNCMNSSVKFFSVRGCRGLHGHGKSWVLFSGDILTECLTDFHFHDCWVRYSCLHPYSKDPVSHLVGGFFLTLDHLGNLFLATFSCSPA